MCSDFIKDNYSKLPEDLKQALAEIVVKVRMTPEEMRKLLEDNEKVFKINSSLGIKQATTTNMYM